MYMYVYVYSAHVCSLNKGGIFSMDSTRAVPSISNWNSRFLFHNHFHLGHSNSFSLLLCAEALAPQAVHGNTFYRKKNSCWVWLFFLLYACPATAYPLLTLQYTKCALTVGSHFDQPEKWFGVGTIFLFATVHVIMGYSEWDMISC